MQDSLEVKIYTRDGILFNGLVRSLSSTNEKGLFDVLPLHSNYITLLQDKVILRLAEGGEKTFPVDNGVLKVVGNKVDIYLGILQSI